METGLTMPLTTEKMEMIGKMSDTIGMLEKLWIGIINKEIMHKPILQDGLQDL